ncbi:membrane-associated protein, putative, partial [Bodo saltans]
MVTTFQKLRNNHRHASLRWALLVVVTLLLNVAHASSISSIAVRARMMDAVTDNRQDAPLPLSIKLVSLHVVECIADNLSESSSHDDNNNQQISIVHSHSLQSKSVTTATHKFHPQSSGNNGGGDSAAPPATTACHISSSTTMKTDRRFAPQLDQQVEQQCEFALKTSSFCEASLTQHRLNKELSLIDNEHYISSPGDNRTRSAGGPSLRNGFCKVIIVAQHAPYLEIFPTYSLEHISEGHHRILVQLTVNQVQNDTTASQLHHTTLPGEMRAVSVDLRTRRTFTELCGGGGGGGGGTPAETPTPPTPAPPTPAPPVPCTKRDWEPPTMHVHVQRSLD